MNRILNTVLRMTSVIETVKKTIEDQGLKFHRAEEVGAGRDDMLQMMKPVHLAFKGDPMSLEFIFLPHEENSAVIVQGVFEVGELEGKIRLSYTEHTGDWLIHEENSGDSDDEFQAAALADLKAAWHFPEGTRIPMATGIEMIGLMASLYADQQEQAASGE